MPPTTRNTRRQTLGAVNHNTTSRRRDSMGPNNNNNAGAAAPSSAQKKVARRTRKSRVSMIPRMAGRENNVVPPSPGLAAPTQSSRQRTRGGGRGGGGGGGGGDRRKTMGNHEVMTSATPTKGMMATAVMPSNPTNSVVRTDPRPIHEKAFQQDCIKKLLNFLLQNGYEHPISQKSLARPSGRDFNNIVTFLLRLVDPNFQEQSQQQHNGNHTMGGGGPGGKDGVIVMKVEDEIAMNFKALGYPFPISKTALVAAGSPHTWPTLLAALSWLIELLEIIQEDADEQVSIEDAKPFQSLEELEITTDKVFFSYLGQSYEAFLRGDEALQSQLEQALCDRFEKDDAYIEQEIERVTDLNAAMVEKMNTMVEESEDLPKLTKKRDDYATDLEQFRDLIRQMDDHIAALNQKVKERSEELAIINKKLDTKNAKVEELKEALEKQAVSLGDIYKLKSDLKGVEEALDRMSSQKEKLRNTKWDGEDQLTNLFTELELLVSDFNSALAEIALLPGMDETAVMKLRVSVNKNQAQDKDQSKLLGVDLASVVHAKLLQYKDTFRDGTAKARQDHQQALDDLESYQQQLAETQEKLTMLEGRKAKMEEVLESERKTQEAKIEVRQREVEAIESSVGSINNPVALEEQMARYERQCAEMEALRLKQQEENLAKKKAVEEEIEAACQAIIELETFCKAKTAEAHDYWLMKITMCSGSVKSSQTK